MFAVVTVVAVLFGGSYLTTRGSRLFRASAPSPTASTQVKTGDPNVLAASGQALLRVVTPPTQTRTVIRLSKDLGTPVFAVEFQPYGLTPNGTAVIRVTKATATGGKPLAAQFAQALSGQNLQATVAPDSVSTLKTGGRYTGAVTLVDHSGTDSFTLAAVHRVN